MQPAIFLDRDGVINVDRSDYVKSIDEFIFENGVKEAITTFTQAGWPIFIISNQACVGKGIISHDNLLVITDYFIQEIQQAGGNVTQVYYCTHTPDDECDCRKPKPGLFNKAASEHDIDLVNSYFIGDATRDVIAGQAAGCKTALLLTGHGQKSFIECQEQGITPDFVFNNISEACKELIAIK